MFAALRGCPQSPPKIPVILVEDSSTMSRLFLHKPVTEVSVYIEVRVERKLGTVGTVVARASARWLRLILGHAQASDVSAENC